MAIEDEFKSRMNEVSFFLRSLGDIEKRQLQGTRSFYRAAQTLASLRSASFIMVYNCIEFAVRESVKQIRAEAADKAEKFEDLIAYWQADLLKAKFKSKLSNGVNFESFLLELQTSIPVKPIGLKDVNALPFAGNIGQSQLVALAKKIGEHNWRPPAQTLGGVDLDVVRDMRNQLAHGDETFENIGGQFTLLDIKEKTSNIRKFMCSYIRMLDRHRIRGRYKIT